MEEATNVKTSKLGQGEGPHGAGTQEPGNGVPSQLAAGLRRGSHGSAKVKTASWNQLPPVQEGSRASSAEHAALSPVSLGNGLPCIVAGDGSL